MTLWPGNNGDCGYVRGCIGKAVEAHLAVGLNCQRANPKGPLGAPGGGGVYRGIGLIFIRVFLQFGYIRL